MRVVGRVSWVHLERLRNAVWLALAGRASSGAQTAGILGTRRTQLLAPPWTCRWRCRTWQPGKTYGPLSSSLGTLIPTLSSLSFLPFPLPPFITLSPPPYPSRPPCLPSLASSLSLFLHLALHSPPFPIFPCSLLPSRPSSPPPHSSPSLPSPLSSLTPPPPPPSIRKDCEQCFSQRFAQHTFPFRLFLS